MVTHKTLPTTFLLDLLFTLAVVHLHPLPVDPLAPIRPPPLPQLYLRHLLPLKIRDPSHLLPPTKTLPLSPRLTPTFRPRQLPLPRRPNPTRPLPPSHHRMSSFSCYEVDGVNGEVRTILRHPYILHLTPRLEVSTDDQEPSLPPLPRLPRPRKPKRRRRKRRNTGSEMFLPDIRLGRSLLSSLLESLLYYVHTSLTALIAL